MIGLALLAIGAVLLWAAMTGRADPVITALQLSVPKSTDASTTSPAPSQQGTASGSSGTDSGSHMGVDANGNVTVINKAYGAMSAVEKDAANAYAKKFGNVG